MDGWWYGNSLEKRNERASLSEFKLETLHSYMHMHNMSMENEDVTTLVFWCWCWKKATRSERFNWEKIVWPITALHSVCSLNQFSNVQKANIFSVRGIYAKQLHKNSLDTAYEFWENETKKIFLKKFDAFKRFDALNSWIDKVCHRKSNTRDWFNRFPMKGRERRSAQKSWTMITALLFGLSICKIDNIQAV